jgi:hypothetical protein
MWIQYRADVQEPAYLRGLKGEVKELEPHWAFQLITDGYAIPVDVPAPAVEPEDLSSGVDESGDSGTGGEEAAS